MPKNRKFSTIFERNLNFDQMGHTFFRVKNDLKKLSFHEGKNDPEGLQKWTQKYMIFDDFHQI